MHRSFSRGWMLVVKSGASGVAAASTTGQSNAGWDPFRDTTPRTSCEDACSAQTTYILSEFLSDARRGPRLAIARALARKGLLLIGDVDYDFTRLRPAEAFPCAFFDAELTRPEGIDILL